MSEYDPEILMRPQPVQPRALLRGTFGKHMEGYSCMHMLRAAVRLGIFDTASEPVTSAEIAGKKGTDAAFTEVFLDGLVQMGLLDRQDGRYVNTVASSLYLDPKSRLYQASSLEGIFDSMDSWEHLEQRLKEGPRYLPRDQVFGERWLRAIAESCSGGEVGTVVDAVDARVDLSGYRTFMDLGGGHGLYTIGFVHRHPNLKGYVFDIPMMCPIAQENSRRYGVPIETVAGDFYKDDLGHYDVVYSSFNLSTSDIRMADRVYGSVNEGGLLILRRHLPSTSTNAISNVQWCLNTWDGKGRKNYGGSWLPSAEEYLERLQALGMKILHRDRMDEASELVYLEKPM